MINKALIIFCDNEHGTGDVCFPDIGIMGEHDLMRLFINGPPTVRMLRKEAKKAGWGRVNGGDYCAGCMGVMNALNHERNDGVNGGDYCAGCMESGV